MRGRDTKAKLSRDLAAEHHSYEFLPRKTHAVSQGDGVLQRYASVSPPSELLGKAVHLAWRL